ncbi:unnamed protein product [Callosobruchus maculatus]|uniref:Uncharacterized protein n=1 Tax=Callosobruchus maculatus TaxID=64391 RepID=A0A653DF16_CALMS|nr:unnamed protein product [Callosobruchus maculatus]
MCRRLHFTFFTRTTEPRSQSEGNKGKEKTKTSEESSCRTKSRSSQ